MHEMEVPDFVWRWAASKVGPDRAATYLQDILIKQVMKYQHAMEVVASCDEIIARARAEATESVQ